MAGNGGGSAGSLSNAHSSAKDPRALMLGASMRGRHASARGRGRGIGAVLESPSGDQCPVAMKIKYSCSHNEAEYEACILGLKVALSMGVTKASVFGD